MEISVEKRPDCLATVTAKIPAEEVKKAIDEVGKEYRKVASLPGYRPGKAPMAAVMRKHKTQITSEVSKTLMREAIGKAATDNKLSVLNAFDVKHGDINESQDLEMTVQLTLEPEFELLDLEAMGLEVMEEAVTDLHVENSVKGILDRLAEYSDVEGRALAMGDYAVLTYDSVVDGKPLGEVAPDAPSILKGNEGMWVHMEAASLWPGFCEALVGLNKDEERVVELVMPEDFDVEGLRGKKVTHKVKLSGIKTKEIPELTDELAEKFTGRSAQELRDSIRKNLEQEAADQTERKKRQAAVEHLVQSIQFEVPGSMVLSEARQLVKDISEAEHSRGVSDEELLNQKEEILDYAKKGGEFRVKADFILSRVAQSAKLDATNEELLDYASVLARRMNISVERFVKQLVKRDGVPTLRRDLLRDKALEFLGSKVNVKKSEPNA